MNEYIETDVLVIGSGIAGAVAALELAEAGHNVTVVTRAKDPEHTNTYYAQGGIIYKGEDDSADKLSEDINRAGVGFSNPKAVSILSSEGPLLVKKILIEKAGVHFDQGADGLLLAREGGHSLPRIIHAADATGKAIEEVLVRSMKSNPKIDLKVGFTAVDLLTPSHHSLDRLRNYDPISCVGAYLFDQKKSSVMRCLSRNVILATGGLGQIYLFTSNPSGARGDGVAMAYRAGARIINMEYVQFHPTTFYHPQASRFLVSEAVRGEGARLTDISGKPFMQNYDSEWKDLASRDVVARSIYNEMLENGAPSVFLDLKSYMSDTDITGKFPNIYKFCLGYGVDITKDLVPVVPAAHYSCGGIWTDEWGRTTIDRLYAVGEVACTGLHGANRLASTSLLEGLVWGYRAAEEIKRNLGNASLFDASGIPLWINQGELADPALVTQDINTIKQIMWNYVGLVRTAPRLARAIRELSHLKTQIEEFYRNAALSDEIVGLRNSVQTAILVASSAWENKNSAGCHFRQS